jgi:PAS domain S-box-containing protein
MLENNEQRYRRIIEKTSEGYCLFNEYAEIIEVNHSLCTMLGYEQNELLGKKLDDFFADRNLKSFKEDSSKTALTWHYSYEITLKHKKGYDFLVHLKTTTFKDEVTQSWQSFALITDMSQQFKTENELERKYEKLQKIMETLEEGLYIINQQYELEYINPVLERKFGPIKGRKCYIYFHQRTAVCPWCQGKKVFSGKSVRWEKYWPKNNQYYEVFDTPLINTDGSLSKFQISHNITQYKKIEQTLLEKNAFIDSILCSSINLAVVATNLDLSITYYNPMAEKLFGYPDKTVLGKNFGELLKQDKRLDASKIEDILNLVKEEGEYEYNFKKEKDKCTYYIESRISCIRDKQKNLIGFLHLSDDVTERQYAEKALRDSEERLRTVADFTYNWEYWIDPRGNCLYISPSCERITGYSTEEFQKNPNLLEEIIHPDDLLIFKNHLKQIPVFKEDRTTYFSEFRIKTRKGKIRWLAHVCQSVFNSDGVWLGRRASNQDITEQKQAEKARQETHSFLEKIMNSVSNAIFVLNLEGHFLKINPACSQITGYTIDELIGQPFSILFRPETLPKINQQFITVAFNAETISQYETAIIRQDGSQAIITFSMAPMLEEEEIVSVVCTAKDITVRKQTEKALRESEERFRSLVEQAVDAIFVHDLEGHFIDVNHKACESVGYSREELLKLSVLDIDVAVNLEEMKKLWQEMTSFERPLILEGVHRHRDGHTFQVDVRLGLIKWNESKYFLASARDISERKQVEETLWKRELQFKMAQEIANLGSYTMNLTTGEHEWSDQMFQILGVTQKELSPSYDNFMLFIHPADQDKLAKELEQTFSGKKSLDTYYRIIRKDGKMRFLHSGGKVEYNSDGEPLWLYGFSQDITERKRAEEKLIVQSKILDSMAEGVTLADDLGHIFLTNPAFDSMFGYEREELIGQHVSILHAGPFEKSLQLIKEIMHSLKQTAAWQGEIKNRKKDGTHFITYAHISALEISNKAYWVSVQEDITERKQAEESLKKAIESANSANRAKSEFLATMSHEIRTPMNAIIGFSELLSSSITDKRHKSYLDSIKVAGNSLISLINDILDLSKIEARKLEIHYEIVNPYCIFNELQNMFAMAIAEKEIEFQVDIDPNLPIALILDGARLRQVLLNLIGNAVKFTEKGYIKLTAKNRYKNNSYNKCDFIISVEDTGIGIPEEQQNIIFESFRQQDGQSTRKYGGTGLGLAISKRLVEMMNGEISLTSQVGEGSLFEVTLHEVKISFTPSLTVRKEERFDFKKMSFEKGLVLVVDDVESNRTLLNEWLSQAALSVIEASDGEKALVLASECQPNLILMDIKMPLMDGYQASKSLKENPMTYNIPIIAFTASQTVEENRKLKEYPFDDYLSKPINWPDLFRILSYYFKPKQIREIENATDRLLPINPEAQAKYSELFNVLEKEMLPIWQEMNGVMEMEVLEEFIDKLMNLGNIYQIPYLIYYAEKMYEWAQTFDIKHIEENLKKFPKIIEDLKVESPEKNNNL